MWCEHYPNERVFGRLESDGAGDSNDDDDDGDKDCNFKNFKN